MEATKKQKPKRPQIEPKYVRPDEAARVLGISRSKLYASIKAGMIPVTRWGGCTLIAVADLHPPGVEAA